MCTLSILHCQCKLLTKDRGVEYSSGGRAPTSKGLDHLIDPAQRMHLQFGLFSVPTKGPQLVPQRLWYVLSYLWESAYK